MADEDTPLEDRTVEDLKAEAEELGVLPIEGSGKGGNVIKDDLVGAVEAAHAPPEPPKGRPPLSDLAEALAAPFAARKED